MHTLNCCSSTWGQDSPGRAFQKQSTTLTCLIAMKLFQSKNWFPLSLLLGNQTHQSFMIGPHVSYLANDPGERSSLVLSYNHRRNQQGPLRSMWQHLAKTQDTLRQKKRNHIVGQIYCAVTPLIIHTQTPPCLKWLVSILLAKFPPMMHRHKNSK